MSKKKEPQHPEIFEFDDIEIVMDTGPSTLDDSTETKGKIKYITSTQNFLPIRDIRSGIIITTDGRFVKLMEFTPINFDLRSEAERETIITQFGSVLRAMPKRSQFKVITNKADVSKYIDAIEADMETESNEYCRSLQQEQINLIARVGEQNGLSRRFFIAFEFDGALSANKKNSFARVVNELNRQGANIRAGLYPIGNEQLSIDNSDEWTMEALYSIVSRKMSAEISFQDRFNDVLAGYSMLQAEMAAQGVTKPISVPINDFYAPQYIEPGNSPKHIIVDDLYYTFAYVNPKSYPVYAAGGWPQILINLGDGVDVDIFVKKEDPAKVRPKLQRKLRFNRVNLRKTEDTTMEYDELSAAIDAGYYLKQGMTSGDDFCFFSTLLTITAESNKELAEKYMDIHDICFGRGLEIVPCNFRQLDAFKMAIPLGISYAQDIGTGSLPDANSTIFNTSKRNVLLSQFASAYPLTSFEMADPGGILFGTSYQNGSLVFVNPFDTKRYNNANMTIIGPSGTGKSYTMQCMSLRMREKGDIQVFAILPEKGHEFYRSCHEIGGQFIRISSGSGQNINVMEIRKKDTSASALLDGDEINSDSLLAQKIQQLHIFYSLIYPEITHAETQLLDEALIVTYEKFGITSKNESLNDPKRPGKYKKMPVLGDLHKTLEEMGPRAQNLHDVLSRFVTGSAASFNLQTNVDLDNQYVVIDLTNLTKELKPIGMFIAIDYVWDKVCEDTTKKKAVFFDELWTLIGDNASPVAGEFVVKVFRLIRGYGGSAIAATQDLNDFASSKFGATIINNSRIKLLLRPEAKESQNLMKYFELAESEVEIAKMMEKGTGLLVANTNHIFINILASQREHDLITTDRSDLARIAMEARREAFGSSQD